ncbi:MAG: hypothetical protein IJ729_02575 [Alloprevotella sp.]|nr:hypothetical protein [Alloprevotella sp.]
MHVAVFAEKQYLHWTIGLFTIGLFTIGLFTIGLFTVQMFLCGNYRTDYYLQQLHTFII